MGTVSLTRGQIRWYPFRLPDKRRPVLVLTRDEVMDAVVPKSFGTRVLVTRSFNFTVAARRRRIDSRRDPIQVTPHNWPLLIT